MPVQFKFSLELGYDFFRGENEVLFLFVQTFIVCVVRIAPFRAYKN